MTLSAQLQSTLVSIFMGIILGLGRDTYHQLIKKRLWWDVLLAIAYSTSLFLLLFQINDGSIRFYLFFAIFFGYTIYQQWISLVYLKLLRIGIQIFAKIYRFLYTSINILFSPMIWIVNRIRRNM